VRDAVPGRAGRAVRSFGFEHGTQDWRRVMDDPDVDIVVIAAPNMLHVELIDAPARPARRSSARSRWAGRPSRPCMPSAPPATPG
jgi:hypothetical protein